MAASKYTDVVVSGPVIDQRPAQATLAIRQKIPSKNLSVVIPKFHKKVRAWMDQAGIAAFGPPFCRFHAINMGVEYEIEIGWPVEHRSEGCGDIVAGQLEPGRYASLIYQGKNRGYQGNKALVEWAKANAIKWDRWDTAAGDNFKCRYESFLSDPAEVADPARWQIEVAIKLED